MNFIFALLIFTSFTFSKSFLPQSFSAKFEESFISLASGKEKRSFGSIDYKYPGQIRFEKTSPDQSLFVSNQKRSWYYVPPFVPGEMGQVTVQKSNKLPLTKFLDSLNEGIKNSKYFLATDKEKYIELNFKPEYQKEMTIKKVTLVPKGTESSTLADFEKLIIEYIDGRVVNLKLVDLKEGPSFNVSHFNFEIPKNTKVGQ